MMVIIKNAYMGDFLSQILITGIARSKSICIRYKSTREPFFSHFFFFLAAPVACGGSWARDQTCATAATQAAAVTTPDP